MDTNPKGWIIYSIQYTVFTEEMAGSLCSITVVAFVSLLGLFLLLIRWKYVGEYYTLGTLSWVQRCRVYKNIGGLKKEELIDRYLSVHAPGYMKSVYFRVIDLLFEKCALNLKSCNSRSFN